MRVPETTLPALTITADRGETEAPYFRPDDAARIIAGAKEPYRTIFALAWCTGLRAGELLGLTRGDLDFERKLIIPRKQADDSTRQLRELKTKKSKSPVAMTREVEAMLANYCATCGRKIPVGFYFQTGMAARASGSML